MDQAPPTNPNPNPKPNVYQISGIPVEFPYKAYGTQLAFMGRVISTLDRAKRQARCHALLESPTGTGKSLSLLCSSLAWQQNHARRFPQCGCPVSNVPAVTDPLVYGGGFIPEPESSPGNLQQGGQQRMSARAQRRMVAPTIYYASRTHSQIAQVIQEFRKTSYRVPMAVLASRKRYCTNKHVCMKDTTDEECKLLLKDKETGCPEFKNVHKVKSHPSLQKGGINEIHDIEDLVKIGRTVKGCSYFASQTLAEEAQIVFCPYSYIINPIVRKAMDIDVNGSIIILDEAHNIEDVARDAGSLDVEEDILYTLQTELGQLCTNASLALTYQPLYDMLQGIISWIGDRKNNLQKRGFEHHASHWTGDKAINELQLAGITRQCFPVLQECAKMAIQAVQDAESERTCLSGMSAFTLESIFSSLGYFFSGNGCHAFDYQLVLQRYVKRDSSNKASDWICSLSLWLLNPAVVFKEIAVHSLSVILTSGTLSPMGSFASELGVQFEASMEAPHVIDVESQLWASVITSGPGNCELNASYKTADGYDFQDSLGASLEEICKIVPGGALIFFPSYKLLEKLRLRWCQTGQWSRLNAEKTVFIEPKGNSDEFDSILGGYYDSIRGKDRIVRGKCRNGQRRPSKHLSPKDSSESSSKGGAAFLAVCRGKHCFVVDPILMGKGSDDDDDKILAFMPDVSEGIDFADENARVVIIVGIPFPNTNDIQIILKKRYNDTYNKSRSLLSGSDWYCQQAFRALNQALGRCIRHRFDYGAIILLDVRFKEQRNLTYISKWLRNSIKQYGNFDESMDGLRKFFEERRLIHKGKEDELVSSDIDKNNLSASEKSLNVVNVNKKNKKQKKIYASGRKNIFVDETITGPKTFSNDASPLSETEAQCPARLASGTNWKPLNSHREFVDLESIDTTLKDCLISEPDDVSKNGNSSLRRVQSFSCCTTEGPCATTSPEKGSCLDLNDAEHESFLNKSVNSYKQRKRKQNDQPDKSWPQKQLHKVLMENNKDVSHIPSDVSEEKKKLNISCLACRNPLGLRENNFLAACSSTSLSKAYLSHILTYGPSQCFSTTAKMDVRVVISDISSIDQRVLEGAPRRDIWCEEDGCVFRSIVCPFCTLQSTCLGVEIKASDSSNVHLLNKVVFFADRLYIDDEQMPKKEAPLLACTNNLTECSNPIEVEKYECKPKLEDSAFLNRTKSKLRLPKREQVTPSQHQDGVLR